MKQLTVLALLALTGCAGSGGIFDPTLDPQTRAIQANTLAILSQSPFFQPRYAMPLPAGAYRLPGPTWTSCNPAGASWQCVSQ